MLSKSQRLHQERDIKKVIRYGRTTANDFFTLKLLPNHLNSNRFTVLVSTKVSKKATKRNRLKRWVREGLRLSLSQQKRGWDGVVIVKPTAIQLSNYQQATSGLFQALSRGGVLCK